MADNSDIYGDFDIDFEDDIDSLSSHIGTSPPPSTKSSETQDHDSTATVKWIRVPYEPLNEAFTCPICQDLFNNPVATVDCMHRFCEECLTYSLSTKRECPVCRTPCPSRRSVRQDSALNNLINKLYPDRAAFEAHKAQQRSISQEQVEMRAQQLSDAISLQKRKTNNQKATGTKSEIHSQGRRLGNLVTVCMFPWTLSLASLPVSSWPNSSTSTKSIDTSELSQTASLFRPNIKTYGSAKLSDIQAFVSAKLQVDPQSISFFTFLPLQFQSIDSDSDTEEGIDTPSNSFPLDWFESQCRLVQIDVLSNPTLRTIENKFSKKQLKFVRQYSRKLSDLFQTKIGLADFFLIYAHSP